MKPDALNRLARMFACSDRTRMKWETKEPGRHDCQGCSAHCGLGLPDGAPLEALFKPDREQLDLFAL